MSDFIGQNSYSGFRDYSNCFPEIDAGSSIIGLIFALINLASFLPQIYELVIQRSSFGISPYSAFSASWAQFSVFLNLFCLTHDDYIGILQIPPGQFAPRFLTFMNLFGVFSLYLPVIFSLYIFTDFAKRSKYARQRQLQDQKLSGIVATGIVLLFNVMVLIWILLAVTYGFHSNPVSLYGKLLGYLATGLEVLYFLPQEISILKIKGPGSLSIVMLCIQGPAGVINSLFMALVNHDDLTSWLMLFVDGCEQIIMLLTCLTFYLMKKCAKPEKTDLSTLSGTILPQIEPVAGIDATNIL